MVLDSNNHSVFLLYSTSFNVMLGWIAAIPFVQLIHLFVMAGTITHFAMMVLYIIPLGLKL